MLWRSVEKCRRYPRSRICAPRKSGQNFTKNFYPLRPPIMPNFIEIGQTSLEIGVGRKKISTHTHTHGILTRLTVREAWLKSYKKTNPNPNTSPNLIRPRSTWETLHNAGIPEHTLLLTLLTHTSHEIKHFANRRRRRLIDMSPVCRWKSSCRQLIWNSLTHRHTQTHSHIFTDETDSDHNSVWTPGLPPAWV